MPMASNWSLATARCPHCGQAQREQMEFQYGVWLCLRCLLTWTVPLPCSEFAHRERVRVDVA